MLREIPAWRLCALAASLGATAVSACSTVTSSPPVPDASANTAQAVIGASGGQLSTPDGVLTLVVPAGAVDHDVRFSVGPVPAPLPGAVGSAFEIGPGGTQFRTPATVTIRYAAGALVDASAADLLVATVTAGDWEALASAAIDAAAMTASGVTAHLSPFAVVHAAALTRPDAGGCTSDNASTGSCAAPARPLCSATPGTTLFSCSDVAGGGYAATCCPPLDAGAPVDATLPPSDGAAADAGEDAPQDALDAFAGCAVDEMTSGTCGAAGGGACADLPGTVVASCVDNPAGTGFTAVCCPPADAGDARAD